MAESIEIDGKKLLPIREAVLQIKYSRDYVTRLAREGKIVATTVGRQWYVDLDSLRMYNEQAKAEQEIRKKQLSEERKRETEIHLAAVQKKEERDQQANSFTARAFAGTTLVAVLGLLGGVSLQQFQFAVQEPDVVEIRVMEPTPVLPVVVEVDQESNLASASVGAKAEASALAEATHTIEPIADEVAEGILLLPEAGLTASVTEMFSDEVQILTNEAGVEMVVRVDENGMPIGNVVPFVRIPVNESTE
jgi:hypothetical protein